MKKYLSGGRLGDFIQQMSVVYEHFLETKEPAVLYITNKGDAFQHGVEVAYHDLQPLVEKQDYIASFTIFNGEHYDVDLTEWRQATNGSGFLERMTTCYGVEWGKHRWIRNIFCEEKWTNKVVINTTRHRFPCFVHWKLLVDKYGKDNIRFVGFDRQEYTYFLEQTGFHAATFHRVSTLMEMATIIASCRLFVGSYSAPMALAFGMHRPCVSGFSAKTIDSSFFHNMHLHIPSVRHSILSMVSE